VWTKRESRRQCKKNEKREEGEVRPFAGPHWMSRPIREVNEEKPRVKKEKESKGHRHGLRKIGKGAEPDSKSENLSDARGKKNERSLTRNKARGKERQRFGEAQVGLPAGGRLKKKTQPFHWIAIISHTK